MTKSKSILVLGVATMMMFSCEMMEPMAPAERAMEAEGMMAGSAFNLSAFGMGMENARSYSEDSWKDECITEEGDFFIMSGSDSLVWGNGNNSKKVSYNAYNTPTSFIIEVTFERNNGNASDKVIATFNNVSKEIPSLASGATHPFIFPLADDWDAGDEVIFSIRQEGQGSPIALSGSYNLVGVCPPVEEGCDNSLEYVDNGDGSYTFTFVPRENIDNARLVFTFAQGVVVYGLEDWSINGATRQKTLDLNAMAYYSWTIFLDADCRGISQPRANLWTDFTVNGESKKCDLENIVISCR